MEMVSTARFRRAFSRRRDAKRYIDGCTGLVEEILQRVQRKKLRDPLLRSPRRPKRTCLLVLTSHRGLCGGYNASIVRSAIAHLQKARSDGRDILLHAAGKRGVVRMTQSGWKPRKFYGDIDPEAPSWKSAGQLAETFMGEFLAGDLDAVEIAHGQLLGAGAWKPGLSRLLPLVLPEAPEEEPPPDPQPEPQETVEAPQPEPEPEPQPESPQPEPVDKFGPPEPLPPLEPYARPEPYEPLEAPEPPEPYDPVVAPEPPEPPPPPEMEYEFYPSIGTTLQRLLPMTVRLRLFEFFMESAIAEQIARRTAMSAAGENAETMIHDLNIRYNRTRQNQITTELAEILGGRVAIEG